MLRLRLIFGTALTTLAVLICVFDARLWGTQPLPDWGVSLLGTNLATWAYQGSLTTLLATVFACLAAREVVSFYRVRGHSPSSLVVQIFAVGLAIGPYAAYHAASSSGRVGGMWALFWLAMALATAYLVQAVRHRTHDALINLSGTMFAILYTGGLVSFLAGLRMQMGGARGAAIVLFTILVAKMTDTGAFFVGRSFGRRKLIEWLSPKKTWEGFFGGLAVAVLVSVGGGAYLHYSGLAPMNGGLMAFPWGLIVYGLFIGLLSVAGDLCASMLKRDAAVKDSSQVIPGMGGVLDVLDSLMLVAPGAWFFWTFLA